MKLLGLDCASKKTGYSVFIDGKLIEDGIFFATGENVIDRILQIKKQISDKVREFDIDHMIPEEVQFHKAFNAGTARDLAWLQGAVIALADDLDLGICLYPSNVWRSIMGYTGVQNRSKQKQWAIDKINEIYGFDYKYYPTDAKDRISDDDKAEAVLIGLAYLKENGLLKGKKYG